MPSASKAPAKGRKHDDGEEARTPLQAVVLADSFTQVRSWFCCGTFGCSCSFQVASLTPYAAYQHANARRFAQRFRPISVERPKVLMPLVNVPMLDYTLEWLAYAGVEEVRVLLRALRSLLLQLKRTFRALFIH